MQNKIYFPLLLLNTLLNVLYNSFCYRRDRRRLSYHRFGTSDRWTKAERGFEVGGWNVRERQVVDHSRRKLIPWLRLSGANDYRDVIQRFLFFYRKPFWPMDKPSLLFSPLDRCYFINRKFIPMKIYILSR